MKTRRNGNSGVEGKIDRDAQTADASHDEGYGRTQVVDKMDTEVKVCEGWGMVYICWVRKKVECNNVGM